MSNMPKQKQELLIVIDLLLNSTSSSLSVEDRDRLIAIKGFIQYSDWEKTKSLNVELLVKWFFRSMSLAEMAKKSGIIQKIIELFDN